MRNFSGNRFYSRLPARPESHFAILPDSDRIKEQAAELVEVLKKMLQHSNKPLLKDINLVDAIRKAPDQHIYDSYKALWGGTLARYPNGDFSDLANLLRVAMLNYLENSQRT